MRGRLAGSILRRLAVILSAPAAAGCGSVACEVRETFGPVAGTYQYHRFAKDGRIVGIVSRESGGKGYVDFTYDRRGHLIRRHAESDVEGYQAPHPSKLDRLPAHFRATLTYEYDTSGRRASARREGDAASETYRYEGDRLVEIRQHGQSESTWHLSYDGPLLTEARYESGGRTTMLRKFAYGPGGRRESEIFTADFLAWPWTYTYAYDAAGRFVERSLVHDGTAVSMERVDYDENGHMVRFRTGGSDTLYEYDAQGRIVRIGRGDDPPQTFEYEKSCTASMTRLLLPAPMKTIWEPAQTM